MSEPAYTKRQRLFLSNLAHSLNEKISAERREQLFGDMGLHALEVILGRHPSTLPGVAEFESLVHKPIVVFTKSATERRYLLFKVLEEVLKPVHDSVWHAYHSEYLHTESMKNKKS